MLNLDKCALLFNSLCGEGKLKHALQDMEAPVQSLAFFFSGYAVIFVHEGKRNHSELKGVYFYLCAITISTKRCAYIK